MSYVLTQVQGGSDASQVWSLPYDEFTDQVWIQFLNLQILNLLSINRDTFIVPNPFIWIMEINIFNLRFTDKPINKRILCGGAEDFNIWEYFYIYSPLLNF